MVNISSSEKIRSIGVQILAKIWPPQKPNSRRWRYQHMLQEIHPGPSNTKTIKLGESITITTRDLRKLALIVESFIIELLFDASFKDPYFYDYVSKSVQNEWTFSTLLLLTTYTIYGLYWKGSMHDHHFFSSMRKGRKTKVTKYERTHHPSNLLISIAIHSNGSWMKDS